MTDSIASRIRSGVAWKAGSQLTLQVSRMAVALILARLLAPEDWGLAAMVLVFSGIVVVFTDSALGTALIQRRTIVEEDRSTVFWTSAGIGLVLMVAGIGLSGPLARFYGEPEVAALFAAVSVGFLVIVARVDAAGAARPGHALQPTRAASDRRDGRRCGRRHRRRARGLRGVGDRRTAPGGGGRVHGAALVPRGVVARPPSTRSPAFGTSLASRATSSARTSSTRPAGTSATC